MIEMLKTRKEELEARGEKGFTLMEMLIVIAIIAVLIAIAIPIFTAQLNSAKAATDEANARSLYAQIAADSMLDEVPATFTATELPVNGELTYRDTTYKFSDVLEDSTIDVEGPGIYLKTNGQEFTFGTVSGD